MFPEKKEYKTRQRSGLVTIFHNVSAGKSTAIRKCAENNTHIIRFKQVQEGKEL